MKDLFGTARFLFLWLSRWA